MDWSEGRNLISAEGTVETGTLQDQDVQADYTYDSDGLRKSKTVISLQVLHRLLELQDMGHYKEKLKQCKH